MTLQGAVIGKAEASDLQEMAALLEATVTRLTYYSEVARSEEIAKYTATELSSFLADPSKVLLLAREGDQRRGKLVGLLIAREDDRTMLINWFITVPEFRRRGLAGELVKHLAVDARAKGIPKLWCDCLVTNLPSASLLLKENFQIFARANRHWYGQDFYLWEKFVD